MKKESLSRLLHLVVMTSTFVVCGAGLVGIVFGQQLLGVVYAGMGAAIALLTRKIADRKRAQEQLGRLNEELEQRVSTRTAELNAANKELEAFSYSVAHDLRAPLRHLSGFVDLLQKHASGRLDEKSQHYLSIIFQSAQKMGLLIDDLLDFSRAGRTDLQKKVVGLDQLVREALHDLRDETEGRNIVWEIDKLPEVYADRSMMRLVMVNLISNALKFSRKREQARIQIGSTQSENNKFVIFVRDNGIGFDMKYVNKLFGVFQRLHRSDEFEGTGIGLANVQRIIHRHGGRIWAEGLVEGGATFFFSLPTDAESMNYERAKAHSAG